ncbi:MAG: hypothetical protein ACYCXP_03615 [Leptospirillum sp.]
MKLPDFLNDEQLNRLRETMKAPLGNFHSISLPPLILTMREQEELQSSGIEIPIEEITISKDSTITFKETHVVLYIRTPKSSSPKFHICNCQKLKEMRTTKRFDRYVVSNREDGNFEIEISGGKKIVPLDVCQYCLENISWKNFSHERMSRTMRHEIVKSFSLSHFFDQYRKSDHPKDILTHSRDQ